MQKKKAPPLSCKNEAFCLETGSRIEAAGLCWECGNGGGYAAAAAERRQGGGLRHETDAPLSMTEMEVKYVLYDGNTERDIKRRTAGERGGIMTLTSSKGRWSWRRRMHSLSIQMDLHTHGIAVATFNLEEVYRVPTGGMRVKHWRGRTHLASGC